MAWSEQAMKARRFIPWPGAQAEFFARTPGDLAWPGARPGQVTWLYSQARLPGLASRYGQAWVPGHPNESQAHPAQGQAKLPGWPGQVKPQARPALPGQDDQARPQAR